jgi:hypothetical protein
MANARKRISEMKTTEEEIHELEKLFIEGLRLQLETVRRKNPYFKGSRQRGSERMRLSRAERRGAVRFARCFVKAYFIMVSQERNSN